MLKCTLADFFTDKVEENMNMDNPNDDHELYVVRDNLDQVLYVGIARNGISSRWFHHAGGHVEMQLKNNHYIFTPSLSSDVGQYIYDMLPLSLEWTIEMWSLNDCIEFLKNDLRFVQTWVKVDGRISAIDTSERVKLRDIKMAEPEMIRKLKPYFNVHYNNGSDKKWDIKWFHEPPHPYYCIWDGLTPINMRFIKHPAHDSENQKSIFDTLVIY
jgi:hypothetical protein